MLPFEQHSLLGHNIYYSGRNSIMSPARPLLNVPLSGNHTMWNRFHSSLYSLCDRRTCRVLKDTLASGLRRSLRNALFDTIAPMLRQLFAFGWVNVSFHHPAFNAKRVLPAYALRFSDHLTARATPAITYLCVEINNLRITSGCTANSISFSNAGRLVSEGSARLFWTSSVRNICRLLTHFLNYII